MTIYKSTDNFCKWQRLVTQSKVYMIYWHNIKHYSIIDLDDVEDWFDFEKKAENNYMVITKNCESIYHESKTILNKINKQKVDWIQEVVFVSLG